MSTRLWKAGRFLAVCGLALLSTSGGELVMAEQAKGAADSETQRLRVYLGTYTRGGESQGIYVCELDLATGALSDLRLAAETVNPSFLAIHPNRRYLYSVSEVETSDGKRGGGVAAFAIDADSGTLELLNKQFSGGAGPCHLVTDREGKCVLVANYGGGSIASLPIGADGRIAKAGSVIQHEGSSVNPRRQEGPHAHSINVDAGNQFAFAADLGLDEVLVYRLDPAAGTLKPNDPPFAKVNPGAGPRHFAFHPAGKFAYVINELQSSVTAFRYDPQRGILEEIHTISTLPDDFDGENTTAEVQVHPSGKFLYGSNRGHDSIAIFSIDPVSGRLTAQGHESTQGETPRNFGVDPTGAYVLAANQKSNSVVVFAVDSQSGQLEPTGQRVEVGSPVCVKFMAVE